MTTNNGEVEAGTGRIAQQTEDEPEPTPEPVIGITPPSVVSFPEIIGGADIVRREVQRGGRDRDRDRARRDVDDSIEDEPAVISPEGESIPLSELPSAEPRRRELEEAREQRRVAATLGLPPEQQFTTRLDLATGQPLETFAETPQQREFRLQQEAALANLFGGGTEGERRARIERARFEQATIDYQREAFNRVIRSVEQVEDANLSETEKLARLTSIIQADFDNFTRQRGLFLEGDIPQAEAQLFARRMLDELRRFRGQAQGVAGADGTRISQADFDALPPDFQTIFLNRGFEALRDAIERRNRLAAAPIGPEPESLRARRERVVTPGTQAIGVGGLPGGFFGAGPPTPEQIEALRESGVIAQPEPVTEESRRFFQEHIDESNRASRELLNDREYYDYLVLTGQAQSALDFAVRNGISQTDEEVARLQREAELERQAEIPFNPLDSPLGILDPRFSLPQSAIASQLIATAARGVTSFVRSSPQRAGQLLNQLKTLEIRAPSTLGSGPIPPRITRVQERPIMTRLGSLEEAAEATERVRRNLRAQLGREPTDAELQKALDDLIRAEQRAREPFEPAIREVDPVGEEITARLSLESARLQREGFLRLFRRSGDEIVDQFGQPITPAAAQRLRELRLRPSDFRPATTTEIRAATAARELPAGVTISAAGIERAEGEGFVAPFRQDLVTQDIQRAEGEGFVAPTEPLDPELFGPPLEDLLETPPASDTFIGAGEPEPFAVPETPVTPLRVPQPLTVTPDVTRRAGLAPVGQPAALTTTGISPITGPRAEVSPLTFVAPQTQTQPETLLQPDLERPTEEPTRPAEETPRVTTTLAPVRLQRTRARLPEIEAAPETRGVRERGLESAAWRQGGTQWINVDPPYEAANFSFPTSRPVGSRVFQSAIEAFRFASSRVVLSQTARDRWAQFFEGQGESARRSPSPLASRSQGVTPQPVTVSTGGSIPTFNELAADEIAAFQADLESVRTDPQRQAIDRERQAFAEGFARDVAPIKEEKQRVKDARRREVGPRRAKIEGETRQLRRPSISIGRARQQPVSPATQEVDF